jgi:hypothetical protein
VPERRPYRWFEPYLWAFGGGSIIGLLYALLAQPSGEIFLTNSWSYVPKDEWWLHAIVVGLSLCLVYGAIVLGYLAVAVLFRYHVLFTVAGLMLVAAGCFFLSQAIWADESTGGRIAWTVMGLLVGGLGVPMIITERRAVWRAKR